MPRQTVILDSTQISAFYDCPTYWNYAHNECISKTDLDDKHAITAGNYGHKILERYYKSIAGKTGKTMEDSIAMEIEPEFQDLPIDLQSLVQQRCREYGYVYSRQDVEVFNPDEVEIPFSQTIYKDNDYLFILEGRIDLICKVGSSTHFLDHKFQMRERHLYKKSVQFRNYALVTDQILGIVNYIRLHKTVTKNTYVREVISFSRAEIRWWKEELLKIFLRVARYLRDPRRQFNTDWHNWKSCEGKFGYQCQYTDICENIFAPELLVNIKEFNYKVHEKWLPY